MAAVRPGSLLGDDAGGGGGALAAEPLIWVVVWRVPTRFVQKYTARGLGGGGSASSTSNSRPSGPFARQRDQHRGASSESPTSSSTTKALYRCASCAAAAGIRCAQGQGSLGGLVCVGGVDVGDAEAEAAPLGCRWLWHRALLIADGWAALVDDGAWSDGPAIWRAPPASDHARLAAIERTDEQWQDLVDALEAQALAEPSSASLDDGLEGVDADDQETTPAGELARAEAWRARWFGPSGWPGRHRARLECAGLGVGVAPVCP